MFFRATRDSIALRRTSNLVLPMHPVYFSDSRYVRRRAGFSDGSGRNNSSRMKAQSGISLDTAGWLAPTRPELAGATGPARLRPPATGPGIGFCVTAVSSRENWGIGHTQLPREGCSMSLHRRFLFLGFSVIGFTSAISRGVETTVCSDDA